jgi:hypothetical protein
MNLKQKHKEWRKKFSINVFTRDDFKCKICGRKDRLDAHHITDRHEMPNGGYVIENGITLCSEHHLQAEQYHISGNIKGVEGMYPNDLYRMIDSSYDLSILKSNQLV